MLVSKSFNFKHFFRKYEIPEEFVKSRSKVLACFLLDWFINKVDSRWILELLLKLFPAIREKTSHINIKVFYWWDKSLFLFLSWEVLKKTYIWGKNAIPSFFLFVGFFFRTNTNTTFQIPRDKFSLDNLSKMTFPEFNRALSWLMHWSCCTWVMTILR